MNKNIQKMGFFKIRSLWMTLIVIALASLIIIVVVNNSNSTNASNEKTEANTKSTETVIQITDNDFSETIGSGVVLVDYWATWCMPCRMQGPIIEKVASEINGRAKICKMDVDQNPVTSANFGIVSIPTIIIFKDGKKVETFVGLQKKETLLGALNKYIK